MSSITLIAFFSRCAGRRLFTVRYLLLFKCSNYNATNKTSGTAKAQITRIEAIIDLEQVNQVQ